jgi:hypothetical protein
MEHGGMHHYLCGEGWCMKQSGMHPTVSLMSQIGLLYTMNLFFRMLLWLRSGTLRLLFLAGFLMLAWGMLAPVGTLVWWFNQSSESLGLKRQNRSLKQSSTGTSSLVKIDCYIVFLTGVGDYSVDQLTPGEEYFLDRLEQLHPTCITVRNVFPYSVANKDLAGERFLTPLWKSAEQSGGWLKQADVLIKIRNLWRFAISADDRYGEIYNQGIADAIIEQMNLAYPIASAETQSKVILIGTSGGVEVALGAVPYLNQWLDTQLIVVSAGGTFDGEAGFDEADAVYHLRGERDWVEDVPLVLFPSRWSWTVNSPINRARRAQRYVAFSSGSHTHDGDNGYFGQALESSSQTPYVELTLQQVEQLPFWGQSKN